MTHARRTTRRLAVAVAALALAVTGCSAGSGAPDKPGAPDRPSAPNSQEQALMTPDQARQKLKALLDDSLSDVKPPLQYWDDWPRETQQTDTRSTAAQNRYIMTKVAKGKFGALLGVLERSWKAKGYTIGSVNPSQPAMFAQTPDGSGIQITVGAADNIAIMASVGPLPVNTTGQDPFGTPTPQPTMSNGNPDMIPKYDDPFWSAN
jgi:hypothetical protein